MQTLEEAKVKPIDHQDFLLTIKTWHKMYKRDYPSLKEVMFESPVMMKTFSDAVYEALELHPDEAILYGMRLLYYFCFLRDYQDELEEMGLISRKEDHTRYSLAISEVFSVIRLTDEGFIRLEPFLETLEEIRSVKSKKPSVLH